MSAEVTERPQEQKRKKLAIEIARNVADVISNDRTKIGTLLCEGLESSIDYTVYKAVYPEFVIVPSNGCTDIQRILPRVRRNSEYPAFGIIDRDSLSKRKIKSLQQQGIYATKLPFIENIICCPEILKVIARGYSMDYSEIIRKIRRVLTGILAQKLMYLNPFNVEVPNDQEIMHVNITITTTGNKVINKRIDLGNIMYTLRDKVIVSEVAQAIGFTGKNDYYQFIKQQIEEESLRDELILIMGKYLPVIKICGT